MCVSGMCCVTRQRKEREGVSDSFSDKPPKKSPCEVYAERIPTARHKGEERFEGPQGSGSGKERVSSWKRKREMSVTSLALSVSGPK